jgi:nitroimidazol reductase NimA-like FMN-containing flavoprotein (pyridoxamine 5'-phosphate oxidase superfamily)
VTTITGVVVATYRSASERAQTANQGPRTIHGILDEGLVGHVGFVMDELPYVIPMVVVRRGEELLLHGSTASRLTRHLATGAEVCVCVTHLDGIVIARSVFDSSMNYRSVVVFGRARTITDEDEKLGALHAIVERLLPGRWQEARIPSERSYVQQRFWRCRSRRHRQRSGRGHPRMTQRISGSRSGRARSPSRWSRWRLGPIPF